MKNLILPSDFLCVTSLKNTKSLKNFKAKSIPEDGIIVDIGMESRRNFQNIIAKAKTVVCAGPAGLFEVKQFASGTKAIIQAVAKSSAYSVAGGGETIFAIDTFSHKKYFSHVSMGGSAMLDFLTDGKLIALERLQTDI